MKYQNVRFKIKVNINIGSASSYDSKVKNLFSRFIINLRGKIKRCTDNNQLRYIPYSLSFNQY